MTVENKTLVGALFDELIARSDTRLVVEYMKRNPHTLEDIGLTLEEFCDRQRQGLSQNGPLRRYMRKRSVPLVDHRLAGDAYPRMLSVFIH